MKKLILLFILITVSRGLFAQKISAETELFSGSITGTGEYFRLAKSGANYKMSLATLNTWIQSQISPGGTVTSVTSGNLSPLFTASVANGTTTPALSFTLSTAAARTYFGNHTSSTAAPSFAAIDSTDIANFYAKVRAVLSATSPLTFSNGIFAMPAATNSVSGYLTSADHTTYSSLVSNATHTGDVTGATALTIANDAVTFAKMQNIGVGLMGNNTGTADPKVITLGTNLSFSGSTLNATGGATTSGSLNQLLTDNGAGGIQSSPFFYQDNTTGDVGVYPSSYGDGMFQINNGGGSGNVLIGDFGNDHNSVYLDVNDGGNLIGLHGGVVNTYSTNGAFFTTATTDPCLNATAFSPSSEAIRSNGVLAVYGQGGHGSGDPGRMSVYAVSDGAGSDESFKVDGFNVSMGDVNSVSHTCHLDVLAGSDEINIYAGADILLNSPIIQLTQQAGAGDSRIVTINNSGNLQFPLGAATYNTSQFDKTTNTTLANVTGLTFNVGSGISYKFEAELYVDANATGGSKFAIGGTATATSIKYQIDLLDNSTKAFTIASRQTALAGSAGQAGTTAGYCHITGLIVVNVGGTLTVQFAQNAATGTSSILTNSTFEVHQIF